MKVFDFGRKVNVVVYHNEFGTLREFDVSSRAMNFAYDWKKNSHHCFLLFDKNKNFYPFPLIKWRFQWISQLGNLSHEHKIFLLGNRCQKP